MSVDVDDAVPVYGLDADQMQSRRPARRRCAAGIDGRYPVDPFGFDPQLADLVAPFVLAAIRVDVEHARARPDARVPRCSCRTAASASSSPRRSRVARAPGRPAGACASSAPPTCPFVGGLLRRLGAIGRRPPDVAALLRAGHLAAVPLAPTWLRTGAGDAAAAAARRRRSGSRSSRSRCARAVRSACRSRRGTSRSAAARSDRPAPTARATRSAAAPSCSRAGPAPRIRADAASRRA